MVVVVVKVVMEVVMVALVVVVVVVAIMVVVTEIRCSCWVCRGLAVFRFWHNCTAVQL